MNLRQTTSALLLFLAAACAGTKDNLDITKPVTGEAATNAQRAYQRGLEEQKTNNFIDATRYFEWVRNNFPYSQYASLSELALADMAFDRDDFTAAATAYQDFVKSHPAHPRADYASFRVGLAHYKDKPSDFWLYPPSFEKDQQPIRDALDSFQRFTLAYPKSEFVPKARDYIAECRERLAEHERFVANFYWKHEAWRGSAARWMGIADTYGDLADGKQRGDALWRAASAYRNAGDPGSERAALARLLQEAPRDPHARDAQARIAQIPANAPVVGPKPPGAPASAGVKPAPATPAEAPNAASERPQAAPAPGEPPGAAQEPSAPERSPKPARPTQQPENQPEQPVSQPPTPPLAPPSR